MRLAFKLVLAMLFVAAAPIGLAGYQALGLSRAEVEARIHEVLAKSSVAEAEIVGRDVHEIERSLQLVASALTVDPDSLTGLSDDLSRVYLLNDRFTAAALFDEAGKQIGPVIFVDDHDSFSFEYQNHEDVTQKELDAFLAAARTTANRRSGCSLDQAYPSMRKQAIVRMGLENDLRGALESEERLENEFTVVFQPIVSLSDERIIGFEALLRWTHPERGVIPPYEFIPILEHTGLIKTFTVQILEKSIMYCKALQDKGYLLNVAVNLSVHNLRDEKLSFQIAQLLRKYKLKQQFLTLEITESAIMNDPERSLDILSKLDDMGIQLSIDDFGTGYSSLSYLKRLPVKQLKIDRSFVSEMLEDKDDAMIVRSTVELAHNLGLDTVAEGVETEAVLDRLKAMNCDFAQGYLISRPLSSDDFLSYLKSNEWAVSGGVAEKSGK